MVLAGSWSPNRLALFPAGTVTAPAGAAGPDRTPALSHTAAGTPAGGVPVGGGSDGDADGEPEVGVGAAVAELVGLTVGLLVGVTVGVADPGLVGVGCGAGHRL